MWHYNKVCTPFICSVRSTKIHWHVWWSPIHPLMESLTRKSGNICVLCSSVHFSCLWLFPLYIYIYLWPAYCREICDLIHSHGGQVYLDGANMNAQVTRFARFVCMFTCMFSFPPWLILFFSFSWYSLTYKQCINILSQYLYWSGRTKNSVVKNFAFFLNQMLKGKFFLQWTVFKLVLYVLML